VTTNAESLFAATLPCRDEDPELFFPVSGPGTEQHAAAVDAARAVCADCPAQAKCLAYVLAIESPCSPHGIWAGTTPEQRSTLRRARRRAAQRAYGRVVDEYEMAGSVA